MTMPESTNASPPWTVDPREVLEAHARRSDAIPSEWWLTAEPYDSGVLMLSGRRSGAIHAEPTDTGAWAVRWWHLPTAAAVDGLDADDDYFDGTDADLGWLKLRAYTALADHSHGDAQLLVDSTWCEFPSGDSNGPTSVSRLMEPVTAGENVLDTITGLFFDQRLRMKAPELYECTPDVRFSYVGGAVPTQAYGTWSGHALYFRYRHGKATLSLSTTDAVSKPDWQAFGAYGEETGGVLDLAEFAYVFTGLATRLAPGLAWYEFTGAHDGTPRSTMAFSEAQARADLGGETGELVAGPRSRPEQPPFTVHGRLRAPTERELRFDD